MKGLLSKDRNVTYVHYYILFIACVRIRMCINIHFNREHREHSFWRSK